MPRLKVLTTRGGGTGKKKVGFFGYLLASLGLYGGNEDDAFTVIQRNDDDFSDRLNYSHTSLLLVMFSLILTVASIFGGEHISCFCPAHFTDNHIDYTNSYCWVKSTYYLNFDDHIPYEHEVDKRYMISYYQWVTIILLLQAVLFYLPCMIWRSMNARSGINVNGIIETAEIVKKFVFWENDNDEEEEDDDDDFSFENILQNRQDAINTVIDDARRFLQNIYVYNNQLTINHKGSLNDLDSYHEKKKTPVLHCFRWRSGHYLIMLYIGCKIAYVANIVLQMVALNKLIGADFHLLGFKFFGDFLGLEVTKPEERFPRTTMCDLKIRRLANLQRYTIQCVLPYNLFNEMVFLVIWWWLVGLFIYTFYRLIYWILLALRRSSDYNYIEKHLQYADKEISDDRLKEFVSKVLRRDGVFLLRLISINTDAMTTTEIVSGLWDRCYNTAQAKKDQ